MDEDTLGNVMMFDQHGAHIRRNLEYSHIATSNHYLCDVAGLLWLGIMLPELEDARAWREFGLRELLNEMDKQVLPDGADYEASTGYHRLKTELFLYSFVLCHVNSNDIEQKYWQKLRGMVDYLCGYVRPDGRAPLIGDTDSGQVLPIVRRSGDDHAYLSALGAAVFQESRFVTHAFGTHASRVQHAGGMHTAPEELFWILGEQGLRDYQALPFAEGEKSRSFPNAGTCVLRENDLYLLLNASDSGIRGRGSHGHNDALSIEVSACGTPFIIDPGSYLYTANLKERHLFRSTAYHSTVQIDGAEQNTISEDAPFVIGDEAHPRVLRWESDSETDFVVAEHDGYQRLAQPVVHRRSVTFYKPDRWWLIEDDFTGAGEHELKTRFHFNSSLEVNEHDQVAALARDENSGARLLVRSLDLKKLPELEPQFTSRDYGAKEPSVTACWSTRATLPYKLRWALIPICPDDDEQKRLKVIDRFTGV